MENIPNIVALRIVMVSFCLRMWTHGVLFMQGFRHRPGWGF